MARARKRGPPARPRGSDGEFQARQKSGSKQRASPKKKRVRKDQQQETIDEGIAATPDDSTLQAPLENDDSTYASSPPNPAYQTIPLQASDRKKATRGAQDNKKRRDSNSGRFAADGAGQTGAGTAAGSDRPSKIVALKVAAHKLAQLLEALGRRAQKIVTLKISPDKLRRFQQELVNRDLLPVNQAVEEGLAEMAPVKDQTPHQVFDDHIKGVVQNLHDLASITHGYLPESHGPLIKKGIDLTHSLAALSNLTSDKSTHPAAPAIRSILIPPEVIDYVAGGRNPDIYTREFVEKVQRGNQVLNGRMEAFAQFAEMYARETKSAIPDLAEDMDRLMEHSGGYEQDPKTGDWKVKKPKEEKMS